MAKSTQPSRSLAEIRTRVCLLRRPHYPKQRQNKDQNPEILSPGQDSPHQLLPLHLRKGDPFTVSSGQRGKEARMKADSKQQKGKAFLERADQRPRRGVSKLPSALVPLQKQCWQEHTALGTQTQTPENQRKDASCPRTPPRSRESQRAGF